MIAIDLFYSLLVTDLAELLLIIVCFFAIRIKLIRIPAVLILISTVIDLLSNYLHGSEPRDFISANLSLRDADAFMAGLHKTTDIIGELFNIFGVGALIVIVLRQRLRHVPNFQTGTIGSKPVPE